MSDIKSPLSALAGRVAPTQIILDVAKLITSYYTNMPDPMVASQRVSFGTSGHRGSAFSSTFNEAHILAISQAICRYRKRQGVDGPLFIGIDTHALSRPAFTSVLEVLAANGVEAMWAMDDEYTPTPVISHAILCYNRTRQTGLADGIVLTPSHNPPESGGVKYNPSHGGPAGMDCTDWIERQANELLKGGLREVLRMPFERALRAQTTHQYNFITPYVEDLGNVIDMDIIRDTNVHVGVDPLGGAGIAYWPAIADRYTLDLTVVNPVVDATFRFMTVDWDGQIRMDPSSAYAMQGLINLKDRFDIAFSCDTDHDRHGIVVPGDGLLPANHYLAVAIDYLFQHRPQWDQHLMVGKTVVCSQMLDWVGVKLGRKLYEVPVGFKWFVDGLHNGALGFAGEESAGASFLRRDGRLWTTDKDGIIAGLLAAEITARMESHPGKLYKKLTDELGASWSDRIQAPASLAQNECLSKLSPEQVGSKTLAGATIESVLTCAPGNGAAIGGIKVITHQGWFAARPSGTEALYRIYAESFVGDEHLRCLLTEAQVIVDASLTVEPS